MEEIDQTVCESDLRPQLEVLKSTTLENIEKSLSTEIEKLLSQIKSTNQCNGEDQSSSPMRRDKHGNLPKKVFISQNSVLTDMWATPHFHSFYNICTALLIFLIINSTLLYTFDSNLFNDDFEFLLWAFGNVAVWSSIWLCMNFSILIGLYPMFRFWAFTRTSVPKLKPYDYMFMGFYIGFLCLFMALPAYAVLASGLPPVSTFFVLMEQIRLMMKAHAFVRHNVPKTVHFKLHQDGDESEAKEPCPEFQKLLYFLFAPTIVYRDEYPRTKSIAWDSVAWHFLQVIITVLVTFIGFRRFVVEIFASAGRELFTPEYFVLVLSGSILMGTMSLFVGFYGLLHCWHNAFAEMLMFADRQFYQDWWNCTTFSKYYRTWNSVVHDWLYAYIYRDIYMLCGKNQAPAMVAVFGISAVVHEYILGLTLRFCYPVLFLFFMLNAGAVVLSSSNRRPIPKGKKKTSNGASWNVFLWFALFLGWGLMIVLYSTEWYARKNCPKTLELPLDYFVPRTLTCPVIHWPFTWNQSQSKGPN